MTTLAITNVPDELLQRARRHATVWLLVVACAATAVAGRAVFLVRPFNPDSAMFIYLGKSVCDGDRYCHDVIDNKFPSVGFMTSIAWRMFGANWPAYIALQTAMSILAAWLLSRCAARNVGEHARLPTALAALVYMNFSLAVVGGFQLETLHLFFATIAACSAIEVIRSRSALDALVVGLGAGCAAMFKPTGLAPLGAFGVLVVALVITRRLSLGRAAALAAAVAAGLAVPICAVLIYLVHIDILRDMPELARQISTYASQTPFQFDDLYKPVVVTAMAAMALVIRGWICRRRQHQIQAPAVDRAVVAFAVFWFGLELLGAVLQRRMYAYHFLTAAAPAALLFGMVPRRNDAKPLLAALAPMMLFSLLGSLEILKYPDPGIPVMRTSAYLAEHASRGDAVWNHLSPRMLIETNLRPGSRYLIMFLFGNYDTAPLDYLPGLLGDFERRRPRFIVLPASVDALVEKEVRECVHLARSPVRAANYAYAWKQVEEYVSMHYVREARFDEQAIYRRRE